LLIYLMKNGVEKETYQKILVVYQGTLLKEINQR